jgi:two-component system osmolarity sensor histidine kinase EnvZ
MTRRGQRLRAASPFRLWRYGALWLKGKMPTGLFARSLLIVILPIALLQTLVAYVFMERHWQRVTHRLSAQLAQEVAFIADLYERNPGAETAQTLRALAAQRLVIEVDFTPPAPLPPALKKPFFSLLDRALSDELKQRLGRPYWLDTIGASNLIEIRVTLAQTQMRVIAHRSQAYASNSAIFLMWMVGAAFVLTFVAVLFLRNQIRPIRRLANAAEAFGKGRDVAYRPSGAREVRQAGQAFVDMKRRVARAQAQRTAMLNGVSHDLRTVLTRFRLSLALMEDSPEREDLKRDVAEMQRMLESYLNFARDDLEEQAAPVDVRALLQDALAMAARAGKQTRFSFAGAPMATVRPDGFLRLIGNLVANAQRYGATIAIEAAHGPSHLVVHVDDDGTGIAPELREAAFRPFHRLDEARNQDEPGVGLGLAIARDLARAHGGDVTLADSPLGGLRASVRLPV